MSFSNLDVFKPKVSVFDILKDRWAEYVTTHQVREVELHEVEKTLSCKDNSRGCFVWLCDTCNIQFLQYLGCNSRLCSCCGKRYTDSWAKNLKSKILKIPHRHLVLSVPDVLWPWLKSQRSRWKLYMDAVIITLNDAFSHMTRQKLKIGSIVVLHPFGKDVHFQPHLHLIITEGGFNSNKHFVHKKYIHAKTLRKKWQFHVLKIFQKHGLSKHLASLCYQNYSNGFYVWVHKDGRINNPKKIAKYIGRYIRHPAIANSRILLFEEGVVTFYYIDKRNDNQKIIVKLDVDDFITALIQHIPDKQFKMIRHYGLYARRSVGKRRKSLKQSSISSVKLCNSMQKVKLQCRFCGETMSFVEFRKPKPSDCDNGGGDLELFL